LAVRKLFRGRKWKGSILMKLLLIYIGVLMPVLTLFVTLYQYSFHYLKDQTATLLSSQSEFFLDGWDAETENIQKIMYLYTIDDDIEALSQIPYGISSYEKARRMNGISKRLAHIMYCNSYITNVSVYIPAVNRKISAIGGTEPIDYACYSYIHCRAREAHSPYICDYPGLDSDSILSVMMYPPMSDGTATPDSFLLTATLSRKKIQADLQSLSVTPGSFTVLFDKNRQFHISSAPDMKFPKELLNSGPLETNRFTPVRMGKKDYQYYITGSSSGYFFMVTFVPENEIYPYSRMFTTLGIVSGFVGLFCLVFIFVQVRSLIHKPIQTLCRVFAKVENPKLEPYNGYTKKDEFQILFSSYNAMARRINGLVEEVYIQKILKQESEFKQLQSQINPHFLYNSFFTLSLLARKGDLENTAKFSHCLGEYFRYITRDTKEEVSLGTEIHHAKQYAEIQKIRFGNRIAITFMPVPQECTAWQVPKLILQPLLENSFVHGLENKTSGGILRVSCQLTRDGLWIHVEDNGVNPTSSDLEELRERLNKVSPVTEITALLNINRRLQLYYGEYDCLRIDRSSFGGWKVSVKILPARRNRHVPDPGSR